MADELKTFPYTNPNFSRGCCCPPLPVHQINLDWILDKMKEASQAVENADAAVREAQKAVEASAEDAATSNENATLALNNAAEALLTANEALNKANKSGEIASGAFAQANEAVIKAESAADSASRAATDSGLALQFAREAVANSATTLEKAENAETVANGIDAKAEEAKTLANHAGELAANAFYQSQQAINKADDADIKAGNAGELAANAFYRAEQADAKAEQALAQGGGGDGATPNWNANEGEAGYIENRTHYKYTETIFSGVAEYVEDQNAYIFEPPFALIPGKEYYVNIGGDEYKSVCKEYDIDGVLANVLGNPGPFGFDDSGEPFSIMQIGDTCVAIMNSTEPTSIIIQTTAYKKLGYEYLPSACVVEISADAFTTGGSVKQASITLDTTRIFEAVRGGQTIYLSVVGDHAITTLLTATSLRFMPSIEFQPDIDSLQFTIKAIDHAGGSSYTAYVVQVNYTD